MKTMLILRRMLPAIAGIACCATGWAQVNGLRGDTSIPERIKYDIFYIEHWSIGFDLKILFLTIFGGKFRNEEKLNR